MTPSRDQDGEHDTSKMITANYCREPRDLEHAKRVLIECAGMASHERAREHAGALGIHPEVPAAMGLTHFHMYLQVASDSMHVWDGGLTERVLVYVANMIYKKAEEAKNAEGVVVGKGTGWAAVHEINCRLAATSRHQEFRHFGHALFKLNDDKAAMGRWDKRIVTAANWRCEEYADVLPQFPYLIAEHEKLARVVMAYIDLYNTMRAVAPTLKCIAKATSQYGGVGRTAPQTIYFGKFDSNRVLYDLNRAFHDLNRDRSRRAAAPNL